MAVTDPQTHAVALMLQTRSTSQVHISWVASGTLTGRVPPTVRIVAVRTI